MKAFVKRVIYRMIDLLERPIAKILSIIFKYPILVIMMEKKLSKVKGLHLKLRNITIKYNISHSSNFMVQCSVGINKYPQKKNLSPQAYQVYLELLNAVEQQKTRNN